MTPEHEEAKTVGAIRMKHPLERGAMCWIFTDEQLAALIAEVRRQIPAELFDGYAVLRAIPEGKHVSADHVALVLDAVVKLIRARLEEGK